MEYIWKQPNKINKEILQDFPELDPIVVQLLYNRGLNTQEKIDEFLNPDYGQDIHDPFLFSDMKKACQRIYKSINKKELITIFGDYDADGVSSSIILREVLVALGAKVNVYLPHREKDGYGLSNKAVQDFKKDKTKVVITVDCGISSVEEIAEANNNNIDVIITDHHSIPEELPKAYSIIHPKVDKKYPFKGLAGGGVAFKLAQGLLHSKDNNKVDIEQEKWLLDMVAIATVADMVPLLGENRTLLKYGLIVLEKTRRIGLQSLIKVSNIKEISVRSIGFSIAPRINVAGRMDHANLAYYLLKEEDREKAHKLSLELNNSNLARQRITEQIFREAINTKINLDDKLLVFYNQKWLAGLTGLIASKLLRKYNRPCLVITKNKETKDLVGSGRSINKFNVTEALSKLEDLLLKFGGHPQACGFSIKEDNLEKFKEKIIKIANKELKDIKPQSELKIELEINFEDINWELVDLVDKFKPFGKDNEEPLFLSKNVVITNLRKVGKDEKHLKIELMKKNKKINCIGFNLASKELSIGNKVDLVYNLSINEWNNQRQIQLIIKDIKINEV